jgi:hypothetical protein
VKFPSYQASLSDAYEPVGIFPFFESALLSICLLFRLVYFFAAISYVSSQFLDPSTVKKKKSVETIITTINVQPTGEDEDTEENAEQTEPNERRKLMTPRRHRTGGYT